MKKILISWLATQNDFEPDGEINTLGPNVNMNAYHWDYDEQILLHTREYTDKARKLRNYLTEKFRTKVKLKLIDIQGVYTEIQIIKNKLERLLLELGDHKIDLLLSTGTGLMKIVWYILHTTLNLDTRLILVMPPWESKDEFIPDLYVLDVSKSVTPVSAIIRELNYKKENLYGDSFVTNSLKPVYERSAKLAQADNVSVLILGETGTGKEKLANFIHKNSPRCNKPFMAINCSAFSDELLEARLFGHKKGSFTGAYFDQKGILELANGGTVFLDEIGDMGKYMQQTLLRFLENKEIHPIGGRPKKVDVRIIAATNKNIFGLVENGLFGADLFYRLGLMVKLPEFKTFKAYEKRQWIKFLLKLKQKEFGRKDQLQLSSEIETFLMTYGFPGNIRELINIIENLYVFTEEGKKAELENLPMYIKQDDNFEGIKLDDVVRNHILKVLRMNNFNKSMTARMLGISLNTLKSKIKDIEKR